MATATTLHKPQGGTSPLLKQVYQRLPFLKLTKTLGIHQSFYEFLTLLKRGFNLKKKKSAVTKCQTAAQDSPLSGV